MGERMVCPNCRHMQRRKWTGFTRILRMRCDSCKQRSTEWRELPDDAALVPVGDDIWLGRRLRVLLEPTQEPQEFGSPPRPAGLRPTDRSPSTSPRGPGRRWVTVDSIDPQTREVTLVGDDGAITVPERELQMYAPLGEDELQLEAEDKYVSRDARGTWWPVTLTARHTDGTYRARVQDGGQVREWAVVLRANIRRKAAPAPAAGAREGIDRARERLRRLTSKRHKSRLGSASPHTPIGGGESVRRDPSETTVADDDAETAERLEAAQRITELRYALWAATGEVHPTLYLPSAPGGAGAAGVPDSSIAARVLQAIAGDEALDSPALGVPTVAHGALCRAVRSCAGVRAALGWPVQDRSVAAAVLPVIGHDDVVSQQDLVDYLAALRLYDQIRGDDQSLTLDALLDAARDEELAGALQLPAGVDREAAAKALWDELQQDPLGSSPGRRPRDDGQGVDFARFLLHFTARAPNSSPLDGCSGRASEWGREADRLFDELDENGDGGVDLTELQRGLLRPQSTMSRSLDWPTGKSVSLFAAIDQDNSGAIDRGELRRFLLLRRCFRRIDADRGGYIDAAEFGQAIAEDCHVRALLGLTPAQAQECFAELDKDGSGAVTFDEFIEYFWQRAVLLDDAAAAELRDPPDHRPRGDWHYGAAQRYTIELAPDGGLAFSQGNTKGTVVPAADVGQCPDPAFAPDWAVRLQGPDGDGGILWLRRGPDRNRMQSLWQPPGTADAAAAHPHTATLGELSGAGLYERIRLLGTGGFGATWLVRRRTDGLQLALKEPHQGGRTEQQEDEARTEVAMLRRLKHPNVVRLCDDFVGDDGKVRLVMELAKHGDLGARLRQGPVAVPEAHRMFRDAALGLRYLHDRRVVHRDVKPENLVIGGDGTVKLCDAGLMIKFSHGMETFVDASGTFWYFAPELLILVLDIPASAEHAEWECSYPVDVWGLGCVLYELAFGPGRQVFPSEDPATGRKWAPAARRRYAETLCRSGANISDAPLWCAEVLASMLHADPRMRITAADALEHLPPLPADGGDDQALSPYRCRSFDASPRTVAWQRNSAASACAVCGCAFSLIYRRHHCRKCGHVVCAACSKTRGTVAAPAVETGHNLRICDRCVAAKENPAPMLAPRVQVSH